MLQYIGFHQQQSLISETWIINYPFGDITVDFTAERIKYPSGLIAHRETTKNFSSPENFVILECITRLFSLGYKPNQIELEEPMPGGHADTGGYCDIIIKDNNCNEFALIECKTADDGSSREFSRAWHRMQEDGGQLFNYFNSFRKAKALCLYASDWQSGKCVYQSLIVLMKDNEEFLRADNKLKGYRKVAEEQGGKSEYFKVWKNTYDCDYSTVGIFENGIAPFTIGKQVPSINDLKDADGVEIQKKYHEYATILRQHNVSGRENAFDKLVNLFLAKIVDESQHPDNLQFYWRGAAHDDYYSLQDRLQHMYSFGMKKFLGEEVTYIDNKTISDSFKLFRNDPDTTKKTILDYFQQLKFYTNNDFAFLDVHNQILFRQNAEILKKVVRMLQDMRLRTDKPNQFLGDLFEGFLDQGIKQSEGQFFTPMPIVRFITSSLPLAEINDSEDIPKAIDYACGAGHFLNEYAGQVKRIIQERGRDPKEYYKRIYGIEKEYRLSKVAKVSAFMYGQDDINIVYQDALRPNPDIQDGTFSVLIANPPYSVKGFLDTLSEEERAAFDLTKYVSDPSSSNCIEVFFIERAAQLLKNGGVAAIILPSSVLSNGNIYSRAREIVLQNFNIISIVEFASGTFGKTGTNTITLFLRKKDDVVSLSEHYRNRVQTWFKGDFTKDGLFEDAHLLDSYCHMQGISRDLYTSLLQNAPDDTLWKHDLFHAYHTKYYNDTEAKRIRKKRISKKYTQERRSEDVKKHIVTSVRAIEMDKLYYYLLAKSNSQPVLIVKSPTDKADVKRFLGYEWSNRKGDEGIKYLNSSVVTGEDELKTNKGIDSIQTPLFNPTDFSDERRINSLIRSRYSGNSLPIPDTLEPFCTTKRMEDMIDFKRDELELSFTTASQGKQLCIESKWEITMLGHVVSINPSKKEIKQLPGNTIVSFIEMSSVSNHGKIERMVDRPLSEVRKGGYTYFAEGDIIIAKITPCMENGKCGITHLLTNGIGFGSSEFHVFRCSNKILTRYVFAYLNTPVVRESAQASMTGASGHRRVPETFYQKLPIPLPPLSVQKQIVDECGKVDEEYENSRMSIENYRTRISKIFTDLEVIANSNGGGGINT